MLRFGRNLLNLKGNQYFIRTIVSSKLPDVTVTDVNYGTHLFQRICQHGNKTAIIDARNGATYTYNDLKNAIKSITSALVKLGLHKGDVVSIYCPNIPEHVFVKPAILRTGASISTINSVSTPEELPHYFSIAKPKFVITTEELAGNVTQGATGKKIQSIFTINGTYPGCRPFSQLLDDDGQTEPSTSEFKNTIDEIAYIPFSSGTTGLPKGVMLSHKNFIYNLAMFDSLIPLKSSDVSAIVLPIFHLYGLLVMDQCLLSGTPAVLFPKYDLETLLRAIQEYKITMCYVVPSIVLSMVKSPIVDQYDLQSLERIVSSAAPLPKDVYGVFVQKFASSGKDIDLLQGYGMTETCMSLILPSANKRPPNKSESVGVVLPNTQFKVVDCETGENVGPNKIGEFAITSPSVMKGYLDNENATKEAIRDGWFFTGDIGYYDEDEFFYIKGRKKELIKYKGFQVAPVELETVLLSHPGVSDCGVVARKRESDGEELPTAFVVKKDTNLEEKSVIDFVAEKVSDYKRLRGGVIFVESIPKSPSGKILRRYLTAQLPS